jgi:hypothetical protein
MVTGVAKKSNETLTIGDSQIGLTEIHQWRTMRFRGVQGVGGVGGVAASPTHTTSKN